MQLKSVQFGTIPKRLQKEQEEFEIKARIENIQKTAMLKSARRVLKT